MRLWGAILVLFSMFSLAWIAAADVNQTADIQGDDVILIKIDQIAHNSGDGDIDQVINVYASNNSQVLYQYVGVDASQEDSVGMNASLEGRNIIKADLLQEAWNEGSGNVKEAIVVVVEDNVQILVQEVDLYIDV